MMVNFQVKHSWIVLLVAQPHVTSFYLFDSLTCSMVHELIAGRVHKEYTQV